MDQNSLATILGSLNFEDGKPDFMARRKELDSLLSTLSNHEIRRMREQLNNVTMHMDICSQLPVEILLSVASHLELEDIFRFRVVSRSWHRMFSSPDLCLGMIQKHFPWARERFTDVTEITTKQDAERQRLLEWFQAASINRLRKLHGQYHSTSTYYYDYIVSNRLTQELQLDRRYGNGRVAFRTSESGILTRNLKTGQLLHFMEKNRHPIQEWFLSDQYLFASTVSPNSVCAWSFEAHNQVQCIRLPNKLVKLSGRSKQVGIVTTKGEILLWTIGGSLQQVNTSDFKSQPRPATTNIFFPQRHKNIFVTCQNDTSDVDEQAMTPVVEISLRLSICEYDTKGMPVASHYAELSSRLPFSGRMKPMLTNRKIFWKLKPRPFFPYTMTSKHSSTQSDCQHVDDSHPLRSDLTILLVSFDIYTKDFVFQTYHLPNHQLGVKEAFFWDDQAIVPVFTTEIHLNRNLPGVNNTLLLGVDNCNAVRCNPRLVPWYGIEDSGNGRVLRFLPERVWAPFENVVWCWIGENNSTPPRGAVMSQLNEQDPDQDLVHIDGDDDFVVLFGREVGMVVWCFDKNVNLPVSWTRLDPSISDALKTYHPLEAMDVDI